MSCFDKDNILEIKEYYNNEGVVCVKDLLQQDIQSYTETLPLQADTRIASRRTLCLPSHHKLNNIVYTDPNLQRVFQELHDYQLTQSSFPMEYREYGPFSKGMNWHSDLIMYGPSPQIEMVYTVFNDDSKTQFQWVDSNGDTQSIHPQKNDMIFVKAGGPLHRVTPLGNNKRGILKIVGHETSSYPLPSMQNEKKNCPMV